MTKRETCEWADKFSDITSDAISACVYPLPSWIAVLNNDVMDVDCESCPCWTPKNGPTIDIHCTLCGVDAEVAAVLVPANSQKICDDCAAELAAEGGK